MSDDYIHPLSINGQLMKKDARIAELEAALKNCADELEVWIDEIYSMGSVLPEHKLRYKRNIESVRTARAALKGENSAKIPAANNS